jgi:hypothetical protein
MKLSHALTLLGVGAGALGIGLATQGCSSSSSTGGTGPSTNGGTVPPAAPSGPTTTVTTSHAYALHTLYLGDQSTAGVQSATAWENFGYNLDGLETKASDTNVCTLYSGAAKSAQVDGPGGVDNSFGENIVPILITVAGQNAATTINNSIDSGSFTVIFAVKGWDDGNATQTATGLTGVLLAGSKFSGTPTFTTADHWPIDDSLVNPPQPGTDPIGGANIKFGQAYVVGGEFVNGSPADVTVSLTISGHALALVVHQAIITWKNGGVGSITGGQIAGVLTTEDLVTSLMSVAGSISTSLCAGTAFQSIATQLDQASDILHNGTNTAGTACDGISIGLGFEAKEIAVPVAADVVAPPAPGPNPCDTDAGTSTGDDGGDGG